MLYVIVNLMLSQRGFSPIIVVICIVIIGLVGGGAFYYQNLTNNSIEESPKYSPSASVIPSVSNLPVSQITPTTTWKTYNGVNKEASDNFYNFSLSYPADWVEINPSDEYVVLVPGDQKEKPEVSFGVCCWRRDSPFGNMRTGGISPSVQIKTFPAGEAMYLWNDGPEFDQIYGYAGFDGGRTLFWFLAPKNKSEEYEALFNKMLETYKYDK
jgi:hypothetical protein